MDMRLIQALDDLRQEWTQVETNDARRTGLLDRLDRLSLLLTYQGFDLEATLVDSYTNDYALRLPTSPDFSADKALLAG